MMSGILFVGLVFGGASILVLFIEHYSTPLADLLPEAEEGDLGGYILE